MRIRPIVCMALVGVLSASGGAAAGYAFASSDQNSSIVRYELSEAAGMSPIHYTASAQNSTTDSAIRQATPDVELRPRYMLGIDHGLVSVFYVQDDTLLLKERTTTPATALSDDERGRLEGGIRIYSDEQLTKALQDYGS